jgi:phosphoglycolate phosphatase
VDNWPSIHAALNATLEAMGHPLWTYEETRLRVRASLRDSFPEMFGDRWKEARNIFYAAFAERHLQNLRPIEGAAELLKAASEQGITLGVVSNKTGKYLRNEADALGWTGYFARIVGAQDAPADKPDRAPIDFALSDTGIEPAINVWFVGDAAIDMRCALAAGCLPVLVGTPVAEEDFTDATPAHHVPDLAALSKLVGL